MVVTTAITITDNGISSRTANRNLVIRLYGSLFLLKFKVFSTRGSDGPEFGI